MNGPKHSWEFRSRFRRNAFGWKSQPAITRIKQAVAEILKVGKLDPELAAEGAVLFLERLSPALERVDSSSGAIGTAVDRAITALVPVIAGAEVTAEKRHAWLERLWQAMLEDQIPYIESLGDHFGTLCVHTYLASRWADDLLPLTRAALAPDSGHGSFFTGTIPCLSAMLAAGRHDEIMALVGGSWYRRMLHYRAFLVRALAAQGRIEDAIAELEDDAGVNDSFSRIAEIGEEILLQAGDTQRAFLRFAFEANRATTFLATYRALRKRYPAIDGRKVLDHCIEQTPGEEGKWFAAARHAGYLDVAMELAMHHRTEPKTLLNAARDLERSHPYHALHFGSAALREMDAGYGYEEPSTSDISAAYDIIMRAAAAEGKTGEVVASLLAWIPKRKEGSTMRKVLERKMIDLIRNERESR